eukprot:TRINITY_DN3739_c0_g1_i13.p1 TRINITY_DN3739_c0_g1~~TRINITY_DN3739_c0_g1_i13.p1  ORF type:complete len:304 (-),score=81.62 TRINITY_DN3739_c0_g1_i13:219-1130(-)
MQKTPGFKQDSTTCQAAIDKFEGNASLNRDGQKACEAKVVKLHGMWPPITDMDASLHGLHSCEELQLSSNCIQTIFDLSPLSNLRVLSMGRNCITSLEDLQGLCNLQQLLVSYNRIERLEGVEQLMSLEVLNLGNNCVEMLQEVHRLKGLPQLKDLVLRGNPLHATVVAEHGPLVWAGTVLKVLPGLLCLDGVSSTEWRNQAEADHHKQLKKVVRLIEAEGGTSSPNSLAASLKQPAVRSSLLTIPKDCGLGMHRGYWASVLPQSSGVLCNLREMCEQDMHHEASLPTYTPEPSAKTSCCVIA